MCVLCVETRRENDLIIPTTFFFSTFFFRLRRSAPPPSPGACPDARYTGPYLWGFAFCRARRDARARRGADTRAVVVLSEAPYSAPLRALAAAAAASYFAGGPAGLEAVAADVATWPAPDPDAPASVAAGGVSLVASAPAAALLPSPAPPRRARPGRPAPAAGHTRGRPRPTRPFLRGGCLHTLCQRARLAVDAVGGDADRNADARART